MAASYTVILRRRTEEKKAIILTIPCGERCKNGEDAGKLAIKLVSEEDGTEPKPNNYEVIVVLYHAAYHSVSVVNVNTLDFQQWTHDFKN